jgi:septal ring factor EnvC (AmiA/AmiB activator)
MALNLLPKGHGRRRAADKVDALRDENRRLLTQVVGASDAFAILNQQLTDVRARQAEAEEIVVQQQADIDDLTAENEQLRDELAALKVRFGPQLAAEANATRITVPPMVRDTSDPDDQATEPIPVMALHAAASLGLLGPVTDPGRIA